MIELIEPLEGGLEVVVRLFEFVLEVISVFCVLIGLIKTGQLVMALKRRPSNPFPFATGVFVQLRLCFGMWLALALEFQLGADILATTVAPSFNALGKLGAIAVIRTFLNYFLNRELAKELLFQSKIEHET